MLPRTVSNIKVQFICKRQKNICRSHDDCEKDRKSTHQIVKEKKSEEKNRAKAVKSLKKKTKPKSLRMAKSIEHNLLQWRHVMLELLLVATLDLYFLDA